jgi:alginate O-acetyltransferase complex protein AlgI
LCLGFRLPDNFRFPFASVGFAAFWRRWHISLTSWIRDYVYANVRGRTSVGRSWRWGGNIMLASILIGVWHGAAWHWILWGAVIGVVILIENVLQKIVPPGELWAKKSVQFALAFITFSVFAFTVLSARARDMDKTLEMADAMFTGGSATASLLSPVAMWFTYVLCFGFFLGHWFMRHSSLDRVAERMPWPMKAVLLAGMFTLVLMSRAPDRAFIYFQF